MRRYLVHTAEASRHPFRQSLPPAMLRLARDESTGSTAPKSPDATWSMQDLRMFLLTYCACFMAVSTFIW